MIFEENQVIKCIKEEAVNLNKREGQMKKYWQKNDFQIEIKAKADAISALKKSLRKIRFKYEKALVQHKKIVCWKGQWV